LTGGPPARVVLVGFMGAGKSTVGPLVAQRLGWSFLDLDDDIEAIAGRTVPEIFATDGEAAFRAAERAAA
jgi:shikimate kinase